MSAAAEEGSVLVVDDDAGLLRLISKALSREGFRVGTADSGEKAKARLQESAYDLMLVDLRLAETTGQQLLDELAQEQLHIPFIVITGQGDERVAVEMMKQGALDYLVKDAEFLESMPTRVRRAFDVLRQKDRLAQAEAALKGEHAFISAILDTTGALVIVLDAEGRVVRFNRSAEQVTGFTAAELAGRPFLSALVPDEEQRELALIFDQLHAGKSHMTHRHHLKTRNGGLRLVTWSKTRIGGSGAQPEFIIQTGIDITERKELERQILEISGREQQRIGQDLHDGLGQHLTGIELLSQCLEQDLARKKRPEAAQAAAISEHVRTAIRQTRSLARGLVPVEVEQHGMMVALRELCRTTSEICRVSCRFECSKPIAIPSNSIATHLYRIAQEAVNNAVKHGRPRNIVVTLTEAGRDRCLLSIRDDGKGFDRHQGRTGMGLGIMKHRASVIGAALEVISDPGKGTELRCDFPRPQV